MEDPENLSPFRPSRDILFVLSVPSKGLNFDMIEQFLMKIDMLLMCSTKFDQLQMMISGWTEKPSKRCNWGVKKWNND
jgi:hypothetical protein